jgi:hypothetical protein
MINSQKGWNTIGLVSGINLIDHENHSFMMRERRDIYTGISQKIHDRSRNIFNVSAPVDERRDEAEPTRIPEGLPSKQ